MTDPTGTTPVPEALDPRLDPTRITGHGGIVDRVRQRTASIGFDLATARQAIAANDTVSHAAALDRLANHLRVIDYIVTEADRAARSGSQAVAGDRVRTAAAELVKRAQTKPSHRPAGTSYEQWIKDGISALAAALTESGAAEPTGASLIEFVLAPGWAADRPSGPRTEKGHTLASSLRRRLPDVGIDYDEWVRDLEVAAVELALGPTPLSAGAAEPPVVDGLPDTLGVGNWPGGGGRVSKYDDATWVNDASGAWVLLYAPTEFYDGLRRRGEGS